MQEEDLSDIINFISLQETVKNNKKNITEKKNNEEDEEDEDTNGSNLLYPIDTQTTSSSIESEPTKDVIKRRLTALQAPKDVKSSTAKATEFTGSVTPTQMAAMGYGTNTIQTLRNRGSANIPNQPAINPLRSMIGSGSLNRMPIAASYDPFSSNKEEINENIKLLRQKVLALLKKEPHKTEIDNMRSEISGE